MKNKYKITISLLLLCFVHQIYAQTTVTYTSNPTNAQINAVFEDSPNVIVSGGTLNAGVRNQQIALFSGGTAAGLEIDEGLFLGTGTVTKLLSLNNWPWSTDLVYRDNNYLAPSYTYNDPNLMSLEPNAIHDVVSYSLNVTVGSKATKMSITYQFGSEEYPDYVGARYNDVFGFFISGPGITGTKNLAKLPNGNDTKVNKINYGVRGSNSESPYYGFDPSQSSLYINNGHTTIVSGGQLVPVTHPQPGPFPVAVQFNGLTKAITFEISNLIPGATYNFKLAIADNIDAQRDAGVFIKKNSLVAMGDIKANADIFNLPCGILTTASVLANDTYNSSVANLNDVQLSAGTFPAGLTLNNDGTVTIAPTVSAGTYNLTYTICDKTFLTNCSTAAVTIVVPQAMTVTSNPTRTLPVNTVLSPSITHTTTLATGIGTPSGLPLGVSASFASNTITISGTPTVVGTFNYSIPLSGGCGTVNATGTIIVTCSTGTVAPNLNNTSAYSNGVYTIPCGATTANLSVLTASNSPNGTTITWHTDPIATDANKLTAAQAASATGTAKYYAAFYNATGGCYSPTKMVLVTAPICATDDDYTATPIVAGVGGTLPSIFGNDTYNGTIISTMPANSVEWIPEIWNTGYATIDGNGNLTISPSAPVGNYEYAYRICDKDPDVAAEDNCSFATVKFTVVAPPFGCNNTMYLSQISTNNTSTTLYKVDTSSNPFAYTSVGVANIAYNAMGLNPVDGKLYAMRLGSNNLVVINTNGSYTTLGNVTGLPSATYFGGEIDNAGNYYVIANQVGGVSTMYRINLTNKTATAISLKYANNTTATLYLPDMGYSTTTGLLYGVHGTNGQFVSITPSGTVTNIGTAPGSQNYGAIYTSSTGEIFGVLNSGGFYQFNLTTGQRVKISEAPQSTGNDGAHCVTAPITFSADLAITKTNGITQYTPGESTTYTVTVSNNGPFGVLNANVSDPVPAGIPAANVSYTAITSSGATTTVSGTQTGAINDLVGIPVGGSVTYLVVVNIPSTFTGNLVNTATVTAPANISDTNTANNTATDIDTTTVCYKPGVAGSGLPTNVGITSLGRGTDENTWPMVREGAWLALESKTQGFVVNRIPTTAQVNTIPNPVEGMMVYDEQADCLKIYTTTNGSSFGWYCFNVPTCVN